MTQLLRGCERYSRKRTKRRGQHRGISFVDGSYGGDGVGEGCLGVGLVHLHLDQLRVLVLISFEGFQVAGDLLRGPTQDQSPVVVEGDLCDFPQRPLRVQDVHEGENHPGFVMMFNGSNPLCQIPWLQGVKFEAEKQCTCGAPHLVVGDDVGILPGNIPKKFQHSIAILPLAH